MGDILVRTRIAVEVVERIVIGRVMDYLMPSGFKESINFAPIKNQSGDNDSGMFTWEYVKVSISPICVLEIIINRGRKFTAVSKILLFVLKY